MLMEQYARETGLGEPKVHWATFAGGNVMNDALLSGTLHFASGGIGPLITLWARTRGNPLDVRGVVAMNAMPLYLNCRNPQVKTIKDLTEKDKIALPVAKISIQAVTLQMAAEQVFGEGQHGKLDALTVSMSHPDGMAGLLSGQGEVTCHFTSPPFQYQELEQSGIHTVLNSFEVLGGPATFNDVWTTSTFRAANPKTYAAFVKAFEEATAILNRDKKAAAELYLKMTQGKDPVERAGFLAVSPTLRMVGRNYGLAGPRYVLHILIPAAFPSILTGMKIGWAFACVHSSRQRWCLASRRAPAALAGLFMSTRRSWILPACLPGCSRLSSSVWGWITVFSAPLNDAPSASGACRVSGLTPSPPSASRLGATRDAQAPKTYPDTGRSRRHSARV